MANILHIETSTSVCSVAISNGNQLIFYKENTEEMSHSSSLAVLINEGLKTCKIESFDLDAVAVSQGPGSYTGLRIGVSTAKGLCYGAEIPLIAIPTLEIMVNEVLKENLISENIDNILLCPMIDARRMEVYNALYDIKGKSLTEVTANIIAQDSFSRILNEKKIYFFGDGADKCKQLLSHSNAIFLEDIYPSAKNMIQLAYRKYQDKKFEDMAYFEPFYLKDFIATIPKKNIYK
ncbi:tRNA (adenosine(37)-N6)-threonylcarbamoyltransferase complex dimerization subunit type 1 TsaB [Bacteroidota bacterium]